DVKVGGGDEHVESATGRLTQRLPREIDVPLVAAGEGSDDRPAHLGSDVPHTAVIPLRGSRKAGFDHVHAKRVELPGEPKFLLRRETVAGSLFAVAQRGIEDQD